MQSFGSVPSFGKGRPLVPSIVASSAAIAMALLGGCATSGDASTPSSSGAAGGSTAVGADSKLQTCAAPMGTIRLQDGNEPASSPDADKPTNEVAANIVAVLNALPSWATNRPDKTAAPSGSASLDSMRLLIQQSNCFVILDRGGSEIASDDEKRRGRNGREMRANANLGPGQEVAADYVLRATVVSLETTGSRGFPARKPCVRSSTARYFSWSPLLVNTVAPAGEPRIALDRSSRPNV